YQVILEWRWPGREPQIGMTGIGLVAAVLVAGHAGWTYQDYFINWASRQDAQAEYRTDLANLARYIEAGDDSSPVVMCSIPIADLSPIEITHQQLYDDYLLHRRDLRIRYFDCTQSLVLANGGGEQRLIFPTQPYYERLPGPLLAWLRYAEPEEVPGVMPDHVLRLDVSQPLADQVGAFITTAPTAWPPEAGARLASLPVNFEANTAFLGYDVRDDVIRSTDWVELTTYWRMDGPPPNQDVTLFAHMLGTAQTIVLAQTDSLGVDIRSLQPRDVFIQYSLIQTPGGVSPGLYALSVGMYFPDSGLRLSAFEDGEDQADRLFLQRIEVRR
ncbi:MAG: hypothetical protein GYB68_03505, partial [Chloroflexi bacterium]|nr:hypothetical protein [Chloroflexota bacterium]